MPDEGYGEEGKGSTCYGEEERGSTRKEYIGSTPCWQYVAARWGGSWQCVILLTVPLKRTLLAASWYYYIVLATSFEMSDAYNIISDTQVRATERGLCVRVSERERACVCEREIDTGSERVCVCQRERESVCV